MDWICQILVSDNTSQVLLNTSIAILTIFIPIALSLFEPTKEKTDFITLDRAVIMDYLVNGKRILWELSLLFLPVFLWSVENFYARVLTIVAWILGIFFAVSKLKNLYSWIRGNRFYYRFLYLTESTINEEAEDLWRSVWEAEKINRQNENHFFAIFKEKVDGVFVRDILFELEILLKLIQDFEKLISKRDILSLTSQNDIFPELLRWHYLSWQKEYSYIGDHDDINKFGVYSSISDTLDQILKKIMERSLNSNFSYGFFKLNEDHINLHKEDKITKGTNTFNYLQAFLSVFFSRFFDLIEKSDQRYDIWEHYFPASLKLGINVTTELPAGISLHEYLRWATDKIRSTENKDYDPDLDEVSSEMFPDTDPVLMSIMLTLLMRSWGGEGRMKSLVEHPRKFGFIGRMFSWTGSINDHVDTDSLFGEQIKTQLGYTINLLCTVFPHEFSEEKIDKYIQELENLSYSDDETKEGYRKQILEYMNQIKAYWVSLK